MASPGGLDPGVLPDPDARRRFEESALPHLEHLYRLAIRLKGSAQDAEDLVQETYVKALRAFPTLRQPESIRAWLCQILTRLVFDHHRTEPREFAVGDLEELDRFSLYDLVWDEDPFPYSDTLHQDFLAQFDDEEVRRALLALPEAYRVPLVLLYVEDLTYKELAEMLECPIGTIMSRLHRGRKILERDLWDCARRRGIVRKWER
ncbi:MAG: sigma-70 family RNA polymerase sigma factor [Candidatus Rokuibacteriota bacterium]